MNLSLTPEILHSFYALALALVLGAIIGFERQWRKHPAGLHTNALVCLGAAAYVVVSVFDTHDNSPLRVAGQVVSGVGFLCAGVVWHEGVSVRGLNTAATVWCTAAIGVLAGLNYIMMAILAAGLLLAANVLLHWIEHRYFKPPEPGE